MERRLIILAEGKFDTHSAKTAVGILRFSPDPTVAVIDSTRAGQMVSTALGTPDVGASIPIVSSVQEALPFHPTALLIGIAPIGGQLPPSWRPVLLDAMNAGLEIISGLHFFLNDDPELAATAAARHVRIWDVRQPLPEYAMRIGRGMAHYKGSHTVYMAGSDCNVGKMTAALVLDKSARERGWNSVFAATGQTGIMISGTGIPADRLISDFINGGAEKLVLDAAEKHDWVFVEGQGSLCHPAYSAVTLGLLHGAQPDMQILCHEANRTHINEYPDYPLPALRDLIAMYESAAAWLKPAPVVGISINTFTLSADEAQAVLQAASDETGLPAVDPVRFGADILLDALANAAK